jgi:hypothetical protein
MTTGGDSMGRLDLPDKQVDWVSVTEDYLHELYEKIERLEAANRDLEQRLVGATTARAA